MRVEIPHEWYLRRSPPTQTTTRKDDKEDTIAADKRRDLPGARNTLTIVPMA